MSALQIKPADLVRALGLDPSRIKEAVLHMDVKGVTLTVTHVVLDDRSQFVTELLKRYALVEEVETIEGNDPEPESDNVLRSRILDVAGTETIHRHRITTDTGADLDEVAAFYDIHRKGVA